MPYLLVLFPIVMLGLWCWKLQYDLGVARRALARVAVRTGLNQDGFDPERERAANPEVVQLLEAGKREQAIALYVRRHPGPVAEAKAAVDAMTGRP
ncbi:hypothetical protein [Oryzihumus leptocrescens]|uniref:Uncharacterized protein n=1 Tax=Oryzihumus leptocrescens TaxID=297536 RepID=A0A542ZNR6_9MICO|nr:hypothetical protein [Oryzihumus leptocrescens]TQL61936.1 hypothetical protein FB474_3361 [Oryzihumus leptocrescens]